MRLVSFQGRDHIHLRSQEGRGFELVCCQTGNVLWIESLAEVVEKILPHKAIVPGMLSFEKRNPDFVRDLQSRRLKWLLDAPKRKIRTKDPTKAPKGKKPIGGRGAVQTALLQQLIELSKQGKAAEPPERS